MIELRSLSSRLIAYWIVGLFFVLVLAPVPAIVTVSTILAGYQHIPPLSGWTTKRSREIVLRSLHFDASGRKSIEPTDELRQYRMRNPEFRFAVIDAETNSIVSGSSTELGSYFDRMTVFDDIYFGFHLSDDTNKRSYGYLVSEETPNGRLRVATYGSYFQWEDLIFQMIHINRSRDFFYFVALSIAMAIVAAVVIRRGLAPLHALATRIAAIDLNTIDQHFSAAGQPTETLPFIEAVNKAFERVNEGVARERRFAANSAHELRTPLTILRSRVETLDESVVKHELDRDVRRMQTIVEQLLVLAQMKERNYSESQPIDLNRLVLAIVTDYAPIAIDNRKNIEFDTPTHSIMARGHEWAVECILTNLIENAIRAEPVGGTVVVRLEKDATIDVVDHGGGVAPADRDMVFEPFWRREEMSPGSGLGLSIVKELVQLSGGRIYIADTPGGGATFRVIFAAE